MEYEKVKKTYEAITDCVIACMYSEMRNKFKEFKFSKPVKLKSGIWQFKCLNYIE
jgi:hypothetical protein